MVKKIKKKASIICASCGAKMDIVGTRISGFQVQLYQAMHPN